MEWEFLFAIEILKSSPRGVECELIKTFSKTCLHIIIFVNNDVYALLTKVLIEARRKNGKKNYGPEISSRKTGIRWSLTVTSFWDISVTWIYNIIDFTSNKACGNESADGFTLKVSYRKICLKKISLHFLE